MLGVCPDRPLLPRGGQEDVVQPAGLARRASPGGAWVARGTMVEGTGGPEVESLHYSMEGLAAA
eukprot:9120096-Alexandrium_andersonii.AAC.1